MDYKYPATTHCILNYKCSSCRHVFKVWVAEDVVVPFMVECPKCKKGTPANHIDWHKDTYRPEYKPQEGDLVVISWDRDHYLDITQRRLIREGPFDIAGAQSYAAELTTEEFENGPPPRVVTTKEYYDLQK